MRKQITVADNSNNSDVSDGVSEISDRIEKTDDDHKENCRHSRQGRNNDKLCSSLVIDYSILASCKTLIRDNV